MAREKDSPINALHRLIGAGVKLPLQTIFAIDAARQSGGKLGVQSADNEYEISLLWPKYQVPKDIAAVLRQDGWTALRGWMNVDGMSTKEWIDGIPDLDADDAGIGSVAKDPNVYLIDINLYGASTATGVARLAYAFELETGSKVPATVIRIIKKMLPVARNAIAMMPDENYGRKFKYAFGIDFERKTSKNERGALSRTGLRLYATADFPAEEWWWKPTDS